MCFNLSVVRQLFGIRHCSLFEFCHHIADGNRISWTLGQDPTGPFSQCIRIIIPSRLFSLTSFRECITPVWSCDIAWPAWLWIPALHIKSNRVSHKRGYQKASIPVRSARLSHFSVLFAFWWWQPTTFKLYLYTKINLKLPATHSLCIIPITFYCDTRPEQYSVCFVFTPAG